MFIRFSGRTSFDCWLYTATAFDPKVIDGIYNVTCLMPAAGMTLLLLALIFLYPLNKKRVEANAAKLREIRAAKEQQ